MERSLCAHVSLARSMPSDGVLWSSLPEFSRDNRIMPSAHMRTILHLLQPLLPSQSSPCVLSPTCRTCCLMDCVVPLMRKTRNHMVGFCVLWNHKVSFHRGLVSSTWQLSKGSNCPVSTALNSEEPYVSQVILYVFMFLHQLQVEHTMLFKYTFAVI